MKSKEGMAIARCYKHGIAISRKQFRKLVQEYNNNEMPISKRVMLIARDWDDYFIHYLKQNLK